MIAFPSFEDNDAISMADGGESMSNEYGSTVLQYQVESF
jgi:hypothetical protein